MYRLDLERQVKTKHPDFNDDDVSRVFGTAMSDQRKSLWEHAETYSGEKVTKDATVREHHAKEFGVNLKEFDKRNKLKEQLPTGGPGIFTEGKDLSFSKRKGRGDPAKVTTPMEAMKVFFKHVDREGGG